MADTQYHKKLEQFFKIFRKFYENTSNVCSNQAYAYYINQAQSEIAIILFTVIQMNVHTDTIQIFAEVFPPNPIS